MRRHRLYQAIRTPAALRTFVEHHVICVLDFMSLLKSLQRELTCVNVPWVPTADAQSARLIQSIVLDEESDVRSDGRVQSHFVWYLDAMKEVGADVRPAWSVVAALERGQSLRDAVWTSALPPAARAFGQTTAAFLERALHVRGAVFFHGREEVLPEMFLALVERLEERGLSCASLKEYLRRHVELDRGEHGPLAEQLLARLYRDDRGLRAEAETAALESLAARERLWDAIAEAALARG